MKPQQHWRTSEFAEKAAFHAGFHFTHAGPWKETGKAFLAMPGKFTTRYP
jgi:hypothetical protein